MLKVSEYMQWLYSIILTIVTSLFGEHWILFLLYLLLNIIDTLTGFAKARINNQESSSIALIGIIRKMGYWIMILIAFLIPVEFQELGKIISVDLSVTIFLGWFVLASLIINECRSILENLVDAGCKVPHILIKGLETASKNIEGIGEENE
ncbi:phage holin family protein [Thomasclavelia spiroformis]|uniref:phage holin family protein n=1 Tax=Thomasclavelia spiroformis TaxID=29348 RepID=UPI00241F631F|nr:phage holin family protein [Thomasclavelia spiroformis]